MKRTLLGLVAVLAVAVAVVILRRGAEPQQPGAPGSGTLPQFKDDSLGVGLLLPESPGWSFHVAPNVPGGGVVMVVHEASKSSVRLYVHRRTGGIGLDRVVQQRRRQLAGIFGVDDLNTVIERVLTENRQESQGYPAWQWQAMTEPVDVPGEEPQRVMFMLLTLERQEDVVEVVGILPHAAAPPPDAQQALSALAADVTFIIQSVLVR